MTTAEIEFEDIREVETTDLSGEHIERLLFEAGYDTELITGTEGLPALRIKGDGIEFQLSEPWADSGNWYIDPATVVVDIVKEGQMVNTVFPSITSEETLVAAIEELAENNS